MQSFSIPQYVGHIVGFWHHHTLFPNVTLLVGTTFGPGEGLILQMPSEKREYKVAAVLAALSADTTAASTIMTFTMRTREEALVVEDTNGSLELPLPLPPISKEDTKTICQH